MKSAALSSALALALGGAAARAEDVREETPGATVALNPAEEARAIEIGKKLRCVVCQGLSIADSPATTARSMMQRVREQVRDGRGEDEIQRYFVARYGEWVLLAPPTRGFHWLVWLGPLLAVALGAWLVVRVLRRPAGAAAPAPSPAAPASDDAYVDAVRRELDR